MEKSSLTCWNIEILKDGWSWEFIEYDSCGYMVHVFNNANWFRPNLELVGVSQLGFKGRKLKKCQRRFHMNIWIRLEKENMQ